MSRFDELVNAKKTPTKKIQETTSQKSPQATTEKIAAEPDTDTSSDNLAELVAHIRVKGRGKSSDPDYTRATIYLRSETHKAIKRKAFELGCDISDLAEVAIAYLITQTDA